MTRDSGNRVQATAGSQVTKFLWDTSHSLPQLALERDGSGGLLRRSVYGNKRLSMTTGGSSHYYVYESLGSVANLTSASGTTEWTYAYEPFGATRTETQDDPAAPQSPIRFTGEQMDPIGSYYLRARQYDPTGGRFLQPDPLDAALEDPFLSTYTYVGSRPTVLTDPSGVKFEPEREAQSTASTLPRPATQRSPPVSRLRLVRWSPRLIRESIRR